MAAFGGLIITSRGLALQAKAQAGATLNYSRIAVGDGNLSGQPIANLTALINQRLSLGITKVKHLAPDKVTIGTTLTNQGITVGFYFREIGIYAIDPDLGEILYAYANAGPGAEFIPPGGSADIVEKVLNVIVVVGQAANVTAIIDQSLVYVTQQEFQSLIDYLGFIPVDGGRFTDLPTVVFDAGTF